MPCSVFCPAKDPRDLPALLSLILTNFVVHRDANGLWVWLLLLGLLSVGGLKRGFRQELDYKIMVSLPGQSLGFEPTITPAGPLFENKVFLKTPQETARAGDWIM